MNFEFYDDLIKNRLTPQRYYHSVCVAKKAAELAKEYGCDTDKAYLAGLMHDVCKNDDDEKILKIFNKFDIIIDKVSFRERKLWHAIAGAAYCKYELHLDDEVCSAIRYHTTGRADMSLLEKIIFIADFVSDDRDYDDVDKVRDMLKYGLDNTVTFALNYSITDLCKMGKAIHPDTVDGYNFMIISAGNK